MEILFCPTDGTKLIPFTTNLPVGTNPRDRIGTPPNGFYEGHVSAMFCPNCGYMTPLRLENFANVATFFPKQ